MNSAFLAQAEQALLDAREAAIWEAFRVYRRMRWGELVYSVIRRTGTAEAGKVHDRIVQLVQGGELLYTGGYLQLPAAETKD